MSDQSCDLISCPVSDDIGSYLGTYSLQNAAGLVPAALLVNKLPPPPCDVIGCMVTDDIPIYLGAFSLQSGVSYTNQAIVIPVPYGNGFYIQPPNTITIIVPPNATQVSYQGCLSTVTQQIPAGSTPAQIQAITQQVMQQVAQQASVCNAPPPTNPTNPSSNPSAPTVYFNQQQSILCGAGLSAGFLQNLPAGFFVSGSSFGIVQGIFSASTQAEANLIAQQELQSVISGGGAGCGWYNQDESTMCPDGKTEDVPAGTVFSTISQADANAKALALAVINCQGCAYKMNWTHSEIGSGATNVSYIGGNVALSVAIPAPGFGQPNVTFTGQADGIWTNTTAGNVSGLVKVHIDGFNAQIFAVNILNNGSSVATFQWNFFNGTFDQTFPITVTPGNTLEIQLDTISVQGLGGASNQPGDINLKINVYLPNNC